MRLTACVIIVSLAFTAAFAQAPDARRRLYPTQDGFLEVDARTGAITECKRAQDGYRCEVVREGDALLKEETGPQAQAPAAPRQLPNPGQRGVGPTDKELDRALEVMERFLRRFLGALREQKPERT